MPSLRRLRVRAPDATREKLLAAAFGEIYRRGFQAASLDDILAEAGVTKGALYHHFADKAALGRAVVDEVVRRPVLEAYLAGLDEADDPIAAIQASLRRRANDFGSIGIEFGCPVNNLAQEMSPVDEPFRRRIASVLEAWTSGYAAALRRGQGLGTVRPDADPDATAAFLVASIEGAFGMAKNARSVPLLRSNLEVLASFLETLRPARQTAGRKSGKEHQTGR